MILDDKIIITVQNILAKNIRTGDISNDNSIIVSTSQMGDEIVKELKTF